MKDCIICKRSFDSNYSKKKFCSSECYKIGRRDCQRRYSLTLKGRKCFDKYMASSKAKIRIKIYREIYKRTDRYKKTHKRCDKIYAQTFIGKLNRERAKRKRRSIKNNIIELFKTDEWLQMKEATKGICPGCHRDVGLNNITLDHIYAVSLASKDFLITGIKRIYTINDIQPLCRGCNSSKSIKEISYKAKPKDL